MAFAQLTYRESLPDIEACLRSMHAKLYHMGILWALEAIDSQDDFVRDANQVILFDF